MKIRSFAASTAVLAATLLLNSPLVRAQDDAPPPPSPPAGGAPGNPGPGGPGGGPGGPGGRGGRGGDPEQWRQRRNDFVKAALKATDDEWSVIQPLIEKVREKQRESMGGGFGGGSGGPGGGRRPNADPNAAGGAQGGDQRRQGRGGFGDASPEAQALRTALENDSTSTTDIKTKLQAVREARKKSAAELAAAREDLKKVLNLRQEAVLVMAGVLD